MFRGFFYARLLYECSFVCEVIFMSSVKLVLHRKICHQSFSTKTLHKHKQTMDWAAPVIVGFHVVLPKGFFKHKTSTGSCESINVQFSCILENKIFLITCQWYPSVLIKTSIFGWSQKQNTLKEWSGASVCLCVWERARAKERKSSVPFPSGVPPVLTGVVVGFLWVLHLP